MRVEKIIFIVSTVGPVEMRLLSCSYLCVVALLGIGWAVRRRTAMPPDRDNPDSFTIVYSTVPSMEVGKDIARAILNRNDAACINLIPNVVSMFNWGGGIDESEEVVLIIKTTKKQFQTPLFCSRYSGDPMLLIEAGVFGFRVMNKENKEAEYTKAAEYWKKVSADLDGMLGGLGYLHEADVEHSKSFLNNLFTEYHLPTKIALDCGCGVGRVTKSVLAEKFDKIDLVDVTERFLITAPSYLGPELSSKIGIKYCCALQNFHPLFGMYNIIWMQWVSGQLHDDDLKEFLIRCKQALLPRQGFIVLKDNISPNDSYYDQVDHSWTRCRDALLEIFKEADLSIVAESKLTSFPKNICEVRRIVARWMGSRDYVVEFELDYVLNYDGSAVESNAIVVCDRQWFVVCHPVVGLSDCCQWAVQTRLVSVHTALDVLADYELTIISERYPNDNYRLVAEYELMNDQYTPEKSSCRKLVISGHGQPPVRFHGTVQFRLRELLRVFRPDLTVETETHNFAFTNGSEQVYANIFFLNTLDSVYFSELFERYKRGVRRDVLLNINYDHLLIFMTALCRYGKPVLDSYNFDLLLQLASELKVNKVIQLAEMYLMKSKTVPLVRKIEFALQYNLMALLKRLHHQLSLQPPMTALNALHTYLHDSGESLDHMHPTVLSVLGVEEDYIVY
ncbi:N-terminal Xaa-Pro-Lys N-methyltransferase 1, partial [Trichinella spiralis]